jgi:hypothetical protein
MTEGSGVSGVRKELIVGDRWPKYSPGLSNKNFEDVIQQKWGIL